MKRECLKCGKCCSYEIPLTLLDIYRISGIINSPIHKIFSLLTQRTVSEKSGLFKMKKHPDGSCIFLNGSKQCSIHENKPNVCKFYECHLASETNILPWTLNYTGINDQALLWEQSVAMEITKKYIKIHRAAWNEKSYSKAIKSIHSNIRMNKNQKIKLARNELNQPICMIYNCLECLEKGTLSKETIITLFDIQRIVTYLKTDWKSFFTEVLDHNLSASGLLKIKRNKYCIFFDHEKHCTIADVRPLHCQFTPCPKRVANSNEFDCFYLGNGSLELQYQHQVAIYFTIQYTTKYSSEYHKKEVNMSLSKIKKAVSDKNSFTSFYQDISKYRYIPDALKY